MKFRIIPPNTERVCRTSSLVSRSLKHLPLLAFAYFLLATSAKATVPSSDLPDLGSLGNFVEFGVLLTNNLSTVNGNAGVSGGGTFDLLGPGTINGNVSVDSRAAFNQMGVVNGSVFNNQDLSSEQSAVISAAFTLGQLTPDQTIIGNQTTGLSFNVPAGQVYVLDLLGGLNLNNQNITLTGGGSLVLNIENSFSLNGSASILGDPANIYINYMGLSPVNTFVADLVNGLFFDPDAPAVLAGVWNGGIFGGDGPITLESGITVNPVPEPCSLILMGLASFLFLMAHRRFRSIRINPRRKL